jgi:peptidoglycan hydrolase FlgJ
MVAPLIAASVGLSALNTLSDAVSKSLSQASGQPNAKNPKAMAAAQDFESVFLNNMFQHMFTNTDGEGPMSGKGSGGVWRSFLTDEYAKSFTKAGGIGITQQVYSSLLAQQEIKK